MIRFKYFMLSIIFSCSISINAANAQYKQFIKEGNEHYKLEEFSKAKNSYKAAGLCKDIPEGKDALEWRDLYEKASKSEIEALNEAKERAEQEARKAQQAKEVAEIEKIKAEKQESLTKAQSLAYMASQQLIQGKDSIALKHSFEAYEIVKDDPLKSVAIVFGDVVAKMYQKKIFSCSDSNRISLCEMSPDRSYILLALENKGLKLINLNDSVEITMLEGHSGQILAMSFSPDGSKILSSATDKTARLWDLSGRQLKIIQHQEAIDYLAFDPTGQYLLSADRAGKIKISDIADGETAILIGHTASIYQIIFSPDQQHILSRSADQTVKIWNLKENLSTETIYPKSSIGHKGWVTDVAYSPNGQYFSTASLDGTAKVYNSAGALVDSLEHSPAGVKMVRFLKDTVETALLSTSTDGIVRLWKKDNNSKEWIPDTITGPGKDSYTISSSQLIGDNKIQTNAKGGLVKLWNYEGKQDTIFNAHQKAVFASRLSPDNKFLMTSSKDHTVKLWAREESQVRMNIDLNNKDILQTYFSAEGDKIFICLPDKIMEYQTPEFIFQHPEFIFQHLEQDTLPELDEDTKLILGMSVALKADKKDLINEPDKPSVLQNGPITNISPTKKENKQIASTTPMKKVNEPVANTSPTKKASPEKETKTYSADSLPGPFTITKSTGLRMEASHTSRVITRLRPGMRFQIIDKESDPFWSEVLFEDKKGWVKSARIKPAD